MLAPPTRVIAAAAALVALGPAAAARAASTYAVTTTTDSNDGSCTVSKCSLRDAVVAADAAGGSSTIVVPAGTYTLTIPSTAADDPTTGDLDINHDAAVTITGAGSISTTIDANQVDRAFAVQSGATLSLSGITIVNGQPSSNSTGAGNGGAIYDAGTLSLTHDVTLADNVAPGNDGGAVFVAVGSGALTVSGSRLFGNSALIGGGIYDAGASSVTLDGDSFTHNGASDGGAAALAGSSGTGNTVNGDEFDDNTAASEGGGLLFESSAALRSSGSSFIGNTVTAGDGGGIEVAGSAPVTLINATISDNTANNGAGIYFSTSNTPTTLTNDTITLNRAESGGGGGVFGTANAVTGSGSSGVLNTIIAENTGGDCQNSSSPTQFPVSVDTGHNLDSDSSCFNPGRVNLLGVANPLIAEPSDNGGSVTTDRLESGSPAIDAGTKVGCPATDARGVVRPQGASCDIGAYEAASASISLTNIAPTTATTGVAFAYTITVSDAGPGPSTDTTVSDPLPPGSMLYGTSSSQGSCSAAGSPVDVTCQLGGVDGGSSAVITLVVAYPQAGSVSNIATATYDEGAAVNATATTNVLPPTTAPTATTGSAFVFGSTTATLAGSIAPGNQPTAYFFEYGKGDSYGKVTALEQIGASATTVTTTISGLSAATTYHFRLVAINDNGTSDGADGTFETGGTAMLGSLVLGTTSLTVNRGKVAVPLTCKSSASCSGAFSIVAHIKTGTPRRLASVTCAKSTYRIAAGVHKVLSATLKRVCRSALSADHGKLSAKLTVAASTGQAPIVNKSVSLK